MASSIIHIAVANEINKELKKDEYQLLLGSIAPDISKQIGDSKEKSHFQNDNEDSIPNINKFLKLYKQYLDDDFVLGYYIHLYTDYLWFKYFIPEIIKYDILTTLEGEKIKINPKEKIEYIYNDYSNLNKQLIEKYNLNIDLFNKKIPKIKNIIKEIPIDKINLLVDKTLYIIENSKNKKNVVFDIKNIEQFIGISKELILSNINQMKKS